MHRVWPCAWVWDVVVGVHTIESEGELRAFAADRVVFCSAWQGSQTEREDDGRVVRGSARAADAHLRMTLEVQR